MSQSNVDSFLAEVPPCQRLDIVNLIGLLQSDFFQSMIYVETEGLVLLEEIYMDLVEVVRGIFCFCEDTFERIEHLEAP